MIPVTLQPEPADFDQKVRRKGQKFPRDHAPLTEQVGLPPYWRDCLDDLYKAYQGVCAYLGIFFERVTGGGTVDHFIAKSRDPNQAYEWSNYRLATAMMNSRKWAFDDVLDPFEIEDDMFHLELVSGRIYPNPALSGGERQQVEDTIERLGLDDPGCREMRARRFQQYMDKWVNRDYFKTKSPFIWYEANRQGLL